MDMIENSNCSVETNKYIGLLGLLCLSRNFFVGWVITVLSHVPIIGRYAGDMYTLFFAVVAVLFLISEKRYIRSGDLIFLLVCIFFCFVSAYYPQNIEYLEIGLPIVFKQVLPCFFIGLCFRVNAEIELFGIRKKGYEWLYFLSAVGVMVNILYYFYFLSSGRVEYEYSGLSEYTLFPTCYLIFYAFYNKKLLPGIIAAIGIVALVSFGVRANIVAALAMLIITIFFGMKKSRKKYIVLSVVAVASVLIYVFFEPILLFLETIFEKMGIGTRIMEVFRTVGLNSLSNREYYWETALEKIKERPFTGYGIFGDRNFFFISSAESNINKLNNYSHNMFLELWADFGVILGTAFFALMIIILIKGFRATAKDGYSRGLYLTLFCAELVVLMVSHSYLTDGMLFFLLGFSIGCYRDATESGILVPKFTFFDLTEKINLHKRRNNKDNGE